MTILRERYNAVVRSMLRSLGALRGKRQLVREIELLRVEAEDLRNRLIAAQQAKAAAQGQSDDLRREKERLRLKVAGLKKDADQLERIREQLQAKITALQEENATLKAGLVKGRRRN